LDGSRKQTGTRKKEIETSRREDIEEDWTGVGSRLERVGGSILKKIGRELETVWNEEEGDWSE
jgi:hypothetical protein